jgi:DNA-directed RNA polymerase subunit K/omega
MKRVRWEDLTKYEIARLVSARALQLAMGAPPLVKVQKEMIDTVNLALMEFERKAIPLLVMRE